MDYFSLNTILIPQLKENGIKFRYINGVYDPMTIIVTHKSLDICRVDLNRDLNSPYTYDVYWFASTVRNAGHLRRRYLVSQELIDDIFNVIHFRGEDKMDNTLYRVTDMEFKSNPYERDEINFTVNIMKPRRATREDGDRIRKAIESNESIYENEDRIMTKIAKFDIKDVIFNNPATIIFWKDGTKTVVKAENEEFDPEKGLAMAIAKKALGNNYDYYDAFKKYVGKYEKKQKKGGK